MKKRYWLSLSTLAALGAWFASSYIAFPSYSPSDHYHSQTGQFYNTPPSQHIDKVATLSSMWDMMFHEQRYRPSTRLPMLSPDWHKFLAPSEHAKFIWFGHSTLMARIHGKTIFIDPVYYDTPSPIGLMMHRFQEPPAPLSDLPPVDLIVYSHAHYDHLDENVVRYFVQHSPQTRYLVPLGVGVYLQKWGVNPENITERDWYQSSNYFGIQFHATPARHNASRGLWDNNKSLWVGWIIQTPNEKIYFSGDSSYGEHFAQIGKKFGPFDLAFVENGQYNRAWSDNHMFPDETVRAVQELYARRWMPIHWGAYPLSTHAWDESVRQSSALSDEKQMNMLTPIMGQIFETQSASLRWWQDIAQ